MWRASLVPLYGAALAVLILDQVSKAWVLTILGTREGAERHVLGDLVYLRLVHNTGAAFGMLPNASLLFGVAAVAVIVGILMYSRRLAGAARIVRVALGLELGGALGNLVDRVRYGYVVDFIDVRVWPYVFNVSDSAITIGVVLLLYHILSEGGTEARVESGRSAGDRAT